MLRRQRTVHLNDTFLDEVQGAVKYVLELVENLGTFTVVDLSKITQRLFTFSYKLNKNTKNCLSSITYFFWVNKDLEDFTTLCGRFFWKLLFEIQTISRNSVYF